MKEQISIQNLAEKMRGKTLSILGDSISSYKGYSNDEKANKMLFYNAWFYRAPFPVEGTYWKMILDTLGMELCVNNSWSGGNLSGRDDENSGVNRASNLSRDDGTSPDFIILFMGMNDLGRGKNSEIFAADYEETLRRMREKYPKVPICCVNMPDRDYMLKTRTEVFNSIIENAVNTAGEGVFIADFFSSPMENDNYYNNTIDGLHPDPDGMRMIAEVIYDAMKKNFDKL